MLLVELSNVKSDVDHEILFPLVLTHEGTVSCRSILNE